MFTFEGVSFADTAEAIEELGGELRGGLRPRTYPRAET